MNQTYLLIGGNIGDRLKNLQSALEHLAQTGNIARRSSVYETAAWGNTDQPAFLNQVIELHTSLPPSDLLQSILKIERQMGRERKEKYDPRTIDIDILLYNDEVLKTDELTIPHPRMHLRRFVLAPLSELAASVLHPVFKKSIDELLLECPDTLTVNKYSIS
ncbi:MAG TPA: 2-amino-4-hydroxy-6-hydroxymethyldihydropteridine diphosphokinase [Chitinophagaceae bacterium]|nr:2-amino-4-hydroxy-6-hydroxymethyldihydropteridine diphosphokinase [Chitinophagaceae bacterium]